MSRHALVVVGSSNTDLVIGSARLPRPGETVAGGEFQRSPGGKGANQAVAAARAGARVVFVGARGDDEFGTTAARLLRAEGIDTRYFFQKKHRVSGVALILLGGAEKQNMIAVAKSANDALTVSDVRRAEAAVRGAGAVVTQLEIPPATVDEAARLAGRHGVPLILNPAPARALTARLLRQTTLITPNESEAELLTGRREPLSAARELLKMGCQNVLVTLGVKGALLVTGGGRDFIKAPRARAVDTVGAGDCLTGWLAALLVRGVSLREAAALAVRAASISVTRRGAQTSMPYWGEVSGSGREPAS
ncbi:MAG: ribokinase [Verrucomicrobiales bacterium]|nr:ribokinase [Verrucomicrobiales bacterium]